MKKVELSHWGIFIGLIVGTIVGYVLSFFSEFLIVSFIVENFFQPVGTVFIRSLFMIVVPLVFGSLTVGVANLGNTKTLRNMGLTVLLFYVCTTFCAILIGQVFVNTIRPGAGLDPDHIEKVVSKAEGQVAGLEERDSKWITKSLWPGIIVSTIPRNILDEFSKTNMLAVIFVSIVFGIGLMYMRDEKSKEILKSALSGIADITILIVGWIMKLAPLAVGCLMAVAVFNFGLDIMKLVVAYIGVVVLGYLTQFFIVYGSILKFLIKVPLGEFYRRASAIFLTAFSTSSSSATMPVTMETLETEFKIPPKIVSFTIPIGITFNMDGTALFEVVAALFVAQVFGVEVTLMGQLTLIALVLLTSIGIAGIPGGSIPILMAAMGTIGIPPEGIALIIGVDRLLDMGRTVVNVTGDSVASLFLAHQSGVDVAGHLKQKSQA